MMKDITLQNPITQLCTVIVQVNLQLFLVLSFCEVNVFD